MKDLKGNTNSNHIIISWILPNKWNENEIKITSEDKGQSYLWS